MLQRHTRRILGVAKYNRVYGNQSVALRKRQAAKFRELRITRGRKFASHDYSARIYGHVK